MSKFSWPLPGEGVTAEELLMAEIRAALASVNTYSAQARRDAMLAEIVAALYNGQGLPVGAGSGTVQPAGRLSVQTTNVANVSTGETDLMSYVLPANSFNTNGQVLRMRAWGTLVGNANAKQVAVYWGGVSSVVVTLSSNLYTYWSLEMVIVRTGASTQKRFVRGEATQTAGASPVAIAEYVTAPAQTDTAAITVKVTGTGGASNDITQTGMLVEFLP